MLALTRSTQTSHAKEVVDDVGGFGNMGCASGSRSGSGWLWCNWERERNMCASDGLSLELSVCRGRSTAPVAVDSESVHLHCRKEAKGWASE